MMVNKDRVMMRLKLAVKAYNSLVEETNQWWMESDDPKVKKLYDKIVEMSACFDKAAKSTCGIKLFHA